MKALPRNRVLVGDVRARLSDLPSASVDCVVTSPPYFLLRDYGVKGQLGLEPSVSEWVDELRTVFRGVARVLKPTGSVWLNVADSYSRHDRLGAPPKSLLLGPERLATSLIADGWIVRNRICWVKSNPLPASVSDRLTCTWEYIYVLTRLPTYYFDLDAIRIPHTSTRTPTSDGRLGAAATTRPPWAGPLAGKQDGLAQLKIRGLAGHRLGKNPGDHWVTAASNFRGAHFATFPEDLARRPILATCPERVCTSCGRAWVRVRPRASTSKVSLRPDCVCTSTWRRGVVLDPFFGSGTVGVVAEALDRDWLGIELNPKFAELAEMRIAKAGLGLIKGHTNESKGGEHHGT